VVPVFAAGGFAAAPAERAGLAARASGRDGAGAGA